MLDLKGLIRKGPSVRPQKILVAGVEGVGKTTFGSQCPYPLFLCAEDGIIGKDMDHVSSIHVSAWGEVMEALSALAADPMGYKTIVIDTLDWMEPLCERFVIERANDPKIKSIEDYGYGKGLVMVAEEMRLFFSRLDACNRAGMMIVVLAHVQIKTFSNPLGENYDRYELKCSKRLGALAREWSDATLFATFSVRVKKEGLKTKGVGGDERIVYTTHSAGWDAKNRHGLPECMSFDAHEILSAMGIAIHDVSSLLAQARELIARLPEERRFKAEQALIGREGDGRFLQSVITTAQKAITEKEN